MKPRHPLLLMTLLMIVTLVTPGVSALMIDDLAESDSSSHCAQMMTATAKSSSSMEMDCYDSCECGSFNCSNFFCLLDLQVSNRLVSPQLAQSKVQNHFLQPTTELFKPPRIS